MSNTRRNLRPLSPVSPAGISVAAGDEFPATAGTSPSARSAARPANSAELAWRKSSFSGGANNCVETAPSGPAVLVRDSKVADGPIITLTGAAWAKFVDVLPGLSEGPAKA